MFRWHPQARLVSAEGAWGAQPPGPGGVIADTGARGLVAAMGAGAFRIGGTGPLPAASGRFQTLSGGTMGAARAISRSFASWQASFTINAGLFGIGPGAKVAALGTLDHSLALYAMVEGLSLGAEAHLLAGLRPDRQRAWLDAQAITHLYATPAQMRLLLATPGAALPALRHILIGGARLDPALRAALAEACPQAQWHEFYGTSEASFIALSDPQSPAGAVGRPYPGVEIACDHGRIRVRSALLAEGVADSDGWCATGEIGRLEGGYLWLTGRAGRAFRIAEHWLHPEEIEAFLLTLPGIQAAAVLPRPDPTRGQVAVAVLQGQGDSDAIQKALRARFGPLLAPRALHWRGDWPILASGKPDLRALALWLEAKA